MTVDQFSGQLQPGGVVLKPAMKEKVLVCCLRHFKHSCDGRFEQTPSEPKLCWMMFFPNKCLVCLKLLFSHPCIFTHPVVLQKALLLHKYIAFFRQCPCQGVGMPVKCLPAPQNDHINKEVFELNAKSCCVIHKWCREMKLELRCWPWWSDSDHCSVAWAVWGQAGGWALTDPKIVMMLCLKWCERWNTWTDEITGIKEKCRCSDRTPVSTSGDQHQL